MGWKRLTALSIFLLASAPLALAHGPSRIKVKESVEINAPVDKVWAKVGHFQDMSWHPAVAKTEGTGGDEVGAKRVLTLQNGGTIEENLEKYSDAEKTYSYRIMNVDVKVLPVTNYASKIVVKAGDGGKTTVEWYGGFYRGYPNNNPPPELNDDAAEAAVKAVYRAGLDNLKKILESSGS